MRDIHRGPDGRFTGEADYLLVDNQEWRDAAREESYRNVRRVCAYGFEVLQEWGNSQWGVSPYDSIRNFKFRCNRAPADAGTQVP